jgi:predicted ATPase
LPQAAAAGPAHNLPSPLMRMIAGADVVNSLVAHFGRCRLITIGGPGGIGKQTVALAVANELLSSFKDKVRFIDLAPLADPLIVTSPLAMVRRLSS